MAAVALLAFAPEISGQSAPVFAGIPWGASATSVRQRATAAGLQFVTQDSIGDLYFAHGADTVAVTMSPTAGLVEVTDMRYRDPAALPETLEAVRDSLRAIYGAGSPAEWNSVEWKRAGGEVRAWRFAGDDELAPAVMVRYRGPGWTAEHTRRLDGEYPALDARWKRVNFGRNSRTTLDTVSLRRTGPRTLTGWYRMDYLEPQRAPSGVTYDSSLMRAEFRCADESFRLLSVDYRLDRQVVRHLDFESSSDRSTAAAPGTVSELLVRQACSHP
jgi:hypothetical protein